MCMYECQWQQNPGESVRSPGAEVTGRCEPSDVGAEY